MGNKYIQWLYDQLPVLESAGVISSDTVLRLKAHYGPLPRRSGMSIGMIICSILAALLIGGGIILVLAHNWETMSRPARVAVALTPLVLSHLLAVWTTATGKTGTAWREGIGIFMTLAVAAAIALIAQTYHVVNDFRSFMLIWMLLTIPAVYLLQTIGAALIYFAGITVLAGSFHAGGGQALQFWGLFALALPFVWLTTRNDRYSIRAALLGWALCLCLCFATGQTLGKVMPGLWIIVYSALFTIMYLASADAFSQAPSNWQKPYTLTGAMGIVILSLLLTFNWPWHHIGRHYYFWHAGVYHAQAAWFDYTATILLSVIAIGVWIITARRYERSRVIYGAATALSITAYLLAARGYEPIIQEVIFNAFLFILGISTIVGGIRRSRMALVNGGMAILTLLILARFFDSEMGLVVRGVAFICVGSGFLTANIILSRRLKGSAHA